MSSNNKTTLGVIIGNRDFFPDKLVAEARAEIVKLFKSLSITPILLNETESKLGGVETFAEAKKCAALFKQHADAIDGILVVLPNFGDEKGVAETIKLSGLNVPVLIQAYPDDLGKMDVVNRRDAWCGKISVCNNLYQFGIKYSLTTKHVTAVTDETFIDDLKKFTAVCKVVKGLRKVRIGAVGARPGAFNTVRYSEKILQRNGILCNNS
jgi:L-fucose isomerase-like protein